MVLACGAGFSTARGADDVTGASPAAADTARLTPVVQKLSRLSLGGYGEAVMSRYFYSQSFNRYNAPERYRNDASHGRFDLPHVTLNLGYDFGHG